MVYHPSAATFSVAVVGITIHTIDETWDANHHIHSLTHVLKQPEQGVYWVSKKSQLCRIIPNNENPGIFLWISEMEKDQ